jgi:hypothetical protein
LTASTFGQPTAPLAAPATDYVPGVCNIGPAEIARRRRTGHLGAIAAVALLALLLVLDAPAWTRLLVFLPAAVSASGYLQAKLRFCAGFGAIGEFNFADDRTDMQHVADPEARRRDRAMAFRIGAASFAIGALVALVAVALPV